MHSQDSLPHFHSQFYDPATLLQAAIGESIRIVVREELERIVTQLPKPQAEDRLLTQDDIVTLYQVTRPTVIAWGKIGKLKPIKMGKRVYYKKAELPK